jgi:hypothetical protein
MAASGSKQELLAEIFSDHGDIPNQKVQDIFKEHGLTVHPTSIAKMRKHFRNTPRSKKEPSIGIRANLRELFDEKGPELKVSEARDMLAARGITLKNDGNFYAIKKEYLERRVNIERVNHVEVKRSSKTQPSIIIQCVTLAKQLLALISKEEAHGLIDTLSV